MSKPVAEMSRAEINAHPAIVPALEAWRAARRHAEHVTLDGRFGADARRAAEQRRASTFAAYNAAVERLLTEAK